METYENCRQLSPPRCSTTTSHYLIKSGVDTLDHGGVFHWTTISMAQKLFKQLNRGNYNWFHSENLLLTFHKTKHINWSLFHSSGRTLATVHYPFHFDIWLVSNMIQESGGIECATACVCFCFVWNHMPHSLTEIKYRNVYPRLQNTHTSIHDCFYSARWKRFHFQLLIHRSNFFYLDQHALWHTKLIRFSSVDALRPFGWIFLLLFGAQRSCSETKSYVNSTY